MPKKTTTDDFYQVYASEDSGSFLADEFEPSTLTFEELRGGHIGQEGGRHPDFRWEEVDRIQRLLNPD